MEGFPVTAIIVLLSAFFGILIGSLTVFKNHLQIPTWVIGGLMIMMGIFLILTTNNHDVFMIASVAQGSVAALLLGLSVGLALLMRMTIFREKATVGGINVTAPQRKERYTIKPQVKREYLQKITYYVEFHQKYLDKDLTLTKLTEELKLSSSYTSRIINESYGKNFKEFINEYRVKDACEKLLSDSMKNYTIEGIAGECGFHSRTAFYNAFKKCLNMSPGEYVVKYRKQQQAVKYRKQQQVVV